ncbi:MAG TPA: hypothetical protein VN222_01355 [Novosphingobium sp.]|nr:hypothetical protein [Novosphingobium sp.]
MTESGYYLEASRPTLSQAQYGNARLIRDHLDALKFNEGIASTDGAQRRAGQTWRRRRKIVQNQRRKGPEKQSGETRRP